MGSVNARGNLLYIDFRYKGHRCRESTKLADNPPNRKKLEVLLQRIDAEITLGSFDYSKYFPSSKLKDRFDKINDRERASTEYFDSPKSPRFNEFVTIWLGEMKIEWSKGHYLDVVGVIDKYLLPTFGQKKISSINKGQILQFRSILSEVPGRKGQFLSASRINHIMTPLRMLLNEAAERYNFPSPWKSIKALKVGRTEVDPFSLAEIDVFIDNTPEEFVAYYLTRFFTGMRTNEVDGLMWKDVDLINKTITVSQGYVRGEVKGLKTDGSYRVINLIDRVVDALKRHHQGGVKGNEFVFTNDKGKPFNYAMVSRTIWYPILEKAKLRKRNPYQTRHTFATLLLASGESPEWIANQMGHTTTTMLFRVYSRYVPNLTRRDGSAFVRFLGNGGVA
ncbi:site-specific integrase [Vibrio kyushuensis]|uniref:Arm DNA-binding domain-containing protein n=1 Tax=Vibrio kyushuensis TaxID=2910249 RepID=UPI003D0CED03